MTTSNSTLYSRFDKLKHPVAQRIASLMLEKKSNLTLSADVDSMNDLLRLAETIGPHVVVLKTHIDCIQDFSFSRIESLQKLADKHRFLIFEDRKFADIGHTAAKQFRGGIYQIAQWAHIVNAHGLPGSSQIESLKSCINPSQQAFLLIANMSNDQTLFTQEYSNNVIQLGIQHDDCVCGFIAPNLKTPRQFLNFSPGIHLEAKSDLMGQRYKNPEQCIEFGVDSIIVGRGILSSSDPVKTAQDYKEIGWKIFSTSFTES